MRKIKEVLHILNRAERRQLGILLLSDVAVSLADIAALACLVYMIHSYTKGGSPLPVAVFFLLFSVKNVLGFLHYRSQSQFLYRVAIRISGQKMTHFLNGEYMDYVKVDSSVHIRAISYQPLEFCQHVLGGMLQILTQCVLIVLAIGAIVFFNAKLFFLLLLLLLPPVIALSWLIKRKLRSVREEAKVSSEQTLQNLQEALSGWVESNVYHKNEIFLERYLGWQRKFNQTLTDQLIVQGIPNRMVEVFALLGVVILVFLGQGGGNGAVTTIGVYMAAAYKIIPGVVKILSLSGQINAYSFTIRDLLSQQETEGQEITEPGLLLRSIRFEQVQFAFGENAILEGVALQLKPGDFLGIAGPSGKGKTTLLNILLGFLEPDQGTIWFNNRPADARKRRRYWQQITYVKQQPFLLHDSILHNITLNEYPYDQGRLQEALHYSGLEEMIRLLPEKEFTVIAEQGRNISGGQRQRIALARAFYKQADLLILDEPFSELDEESEIRLLRHFRQLAEKGKMVILISHNKSSLGYCNKLFSMDAKTTPTHEA